jgi:NADPH:quinone reductase-like Zn-dependent oxidoreductase
MQAVLFKSYGSPDVLKIGDLQEPKPADDEVLVRNAASLNSWD